MKGAGCSLANRPSSNSTSPASIQSLTNAAIVSCVAIGDCAFHGPGRELQRRSSLELRLVDTRLHSPVGRVMLQGDDASLFGYRSGSGKDCPTAAEAVLAGKGIEQEHNGGIAVILQADIERRYRETASSGVHRRIRCRASHGSGPDGEARAGWRITRDGYAGTIICCCRGERRNLATGRHTNTLVCHYRLVGRASDRRRLSIVDCNRERAAWPCGSHAGDRRCAF